MPLVEELNIEKVKKKGLFVMDCRASYEARNDGIFGNCTPSHDEERQFK